MMRRLPVWHLRSHLAALLVVAMLLTFALVLGGLLAYRAPRIEAESQRMQQHDVGEIRVRMEMLLQARKARLVLLEALMDAAPPEQADTLLDHGVGDSQALEAIYRLSPQGRILAIGLPAAWRHQRAAFLGIDLSGNPLFQAVAAQPGVAWRGGYASVLNGATTVGVAWRDGHGHVMIGEVAFSSLMDAVQLSAGARGSAVWVVDRSGEIVADSRGGQDVGTVNLLQWPLMQALLQGRHVPADSFAFAGHTYHAAVSHSPELGWYFLSRVPVGLDNPQVRGLVLSVVAALGGGLVVSLLMAPFWARRLAEPLRRIIARADRGTSGQDKGEPWPRGSVAEFNRLSAHLESMTGELLERERKAQAIFHASPVPMAFADADDDWRLLDVNQAWCEEFRFRREQVLLRTTAEIDLWVDPRQRVALRASVEGDEPVGDTWLRRSDGSTLLVHLHGRIAQLPSARVAIWAAVPIGPMRLAEQALRELNQQLEDRVQRRSEALASSNEELTRMVAQLRATQDDLVRTEKLAALGSLVAGVAHELNTPLGNGVMAVSALADATRSFKAAMAGGLTRADLQRMLESLEQGTDIGLRNLRRADELVQSFKQVAADQASSRRRSFELAEVVHEMVVSLQPSFARKPYQVEVDVPATGLRLDSYPGPLSQTLGNLIQNAVLHGFDGLAQGTVRISAGRFEDGWIWLRVADDGRGIAPEHIDRIFDPFMTTRLGRGGTGLGLHISYNAVVDVLGGQLTVTSQPGQGACFTLRLPVSAPLQAAYQGSPQAGCS